MASTNQSPFYQKAESKFLDAQTDSEKIKWLDEMIKECPKHKSAEKMLANLKTRRKKLLVKLEKSSQEELESELVSHKVPQSIKLSSQLFDDLKRLIGKDLELLI